MNKTRTRIESTGRRARGTLRNMSNRASRLPGTYAKAWARQMGAWTDLATDVFDGSVSLRDALSGMVALSFSGLQTSVDLGREVCELMILPISPAGVIEFHLDGKSESADPIELDATAPVTAGELAATDLKNVDNPSGPSIPSRHVRFTTPQAPSQPVLVSLAELGDLVPALPDGTYEGKLRKGGVDIATIRALVDN